MRAGDLQRHGQGGGTAQERITVHAIPLANVASWLRDREFAGTLVDPKVWSGLYFATSLR